MSVLLGFFLVGFYQGSQRMALSMLVEQDRNEALLQSRRIGELWRGGGSVPSTANAQYFLNGIAYTLSTNSLPDQYGATNSTLSRLGLTLTWKEPNPNSLSARNMYIKDVYFQY